MLAIGLLVDDAIAAVVENVERVIVEEKMHPRRKRRINRWGTSNVRWSVLLLFFP
ncbi:efflux RND transporter permease subunit [Shigella flexneri]